MSCLPQLIGGGHATRSVENGHWRQIRRQVIAEANELALKGVVVADYSLPAEQVPHVQRELANVTRLIAKVSLKIRGKEPVLGCEIGNVNLVSVRGPIELAS